MDGNDLYEYMDIVQTNRSAEISSLPTWQLRLNVALPTSVPATGNQIRHKFKANGTCT